MQYSTNTRIEHVCYRSRGNLLVLTRAFFVKKEIYMGFLLNSQAQGVSGKTEQSPPTPWRGAPEARGPMQLHRLKVSASSCMRSMNKATNVRMLN